MLFKQKKPELLQVFFVCSGDPAGIRTQDHYIKSVMLYQLSYGIVKRGAKVRFLLV